MTDQEQKITETTTSTSNDEQQSVENSEKTKENEPKSSESEERPTRRSTISEDIRCSTDRNDRDKLMEKYENYQVSSINACNIRFLADHRQKQSLFGRPEGMCIISPRISSHFFSFLEENSNLQTLAKTFSVNMFVSILILLCVLMID